jgi:hypothetical protein
VRLGTRTKKIAERSHYYLSSSVTFCHGAEKGGHTIQVSPPLWGQKRAQKTVVPPSGHKNIVPSKLKVQRLLSCQPQRTENTIFSITLSLQIAKIATDRGLLHPVPPARYLLPYFCGQTQLQNIVPPPLQNPGSATDLLV